MDEIYVKDSFVFQFDIIQANMEIKFPCKVSLICKCNQEEKNTLPKDLIKNQVALIQQNIKIETSFERKEGSSLYDNKMVEFTIMLSTQNGHKLAGYISVDVNDILKWPNQHQHKLQVQRCPDRSATVLMKVRYQQIGSHKMQYHKKTTFEQQYGRQIFNIPKKQFKDQKEDSKEKQNFYKTTRESFGWKKSQEKLFDQDKVHRKKLRNYQSRITQLNKQDNDNLKRKNQYLEKELSEKYSSIQELQRQNFKHTLAIRTLTSKNQEQSLRISELTQQIKERVKQNAFIKQKSQQVYCEYNINEKKYHLKEDLLKNQIASLQQKVFNMRMQNDKYSQVVNNISTDSEHYQVQSIYILLIQYKTQLKRIASLLYQTITRYRDKKEGIQLEQRVNSVIDKLAKKCFQEEQKMDLMYSIKQFRRLEDKLKKQNERFTKEVNQKNKQIMDLRNQIQKSHKQGFSQMKQFKNKVIQYQKDLNNSKIYSEQISTENKNLRHDNQILSGQNKKYRLNIQEIQHQKTLLESKMVIEQNRNQDMSLEIDRLRSLNDDLKKRLAKTQNQLQRAKKLYDQLKSKHQNFNSQVQVKVKQVQQMIRQRASLQKMCENSQKKLQSQLKQVQSLKNECMQLKQINKDYQKHLKIRENQIKQLNSELHQKTKEHNLRMQQEKQKHYKLEKQIRVKDNKLKIDQQQFQRLEFEMDQLKSLLKSQRESIQRVQQKNKLQRKSLQRQVQQINEFKQKQIEQLIQSKNPIYKILKQKQKKYQQCMEQLRTLQDYKYKASNQLSQKQKTIHNIQKSNMEYSQIITRLGMDLQKKDYDLSSKIKKIQSLIFEMNHLKQQIQGLQNQKQQLSQKCKEYNQRIKQAIQCNRQLENQKKVSEEFRVKNQEEILQLRANFNDQISKNQLKFKHFQSQLGTSGERNQVLMNKISQGERQNKQLREQLHLCKMEFENLLKIQKELAKQHTNAEFMDEMNRLSQQLFDKQNQILKLQTHKNRLSKQIDNLKCKLTYQSSQNQLLQNSLIQSIQQNRKLSNQNDNISSEFKNKELMIKQKEKEIAFILKQKQISLDQLKRIEYKFNDLQAKQREHQIKLQENQQTINYLRGRVKYTTQQAISLRNEMQKNNYKYSMALTDDKSKSEIEQMKGQVEKYKKLSQKLSRQIKYRQKEVENLQSQIQQFLNSEKA